MYSLEIEGRIMRRIGRCRNYNIQYKEIKSYIYHSISVLVSYTKSDNIYDVDCCNTNFK